MSSQKLDGPYIVSASPNSKLSTNFKAKEYMATDGSLYVHQDLVAGVQLLRDLVGPMSVNSVRPRAMGKGLGVSLKATDLDTLLASALELKKQGIFSEVLSQSSSAVVVGVQSEGRAKNLKPVFAFDCGLQVVANYETQGDPYQQVTGNFDGAGLSFGVIQFNFKSETLQKLFGMFRVADERALQACFGTEERYDEITRIMAAPASKAIKWGNEISTGRNRSGVSEPWKSCFRAVGKVEEFRNIQMMFAYDRYGRLLMETLAFLEGLSQLRIRNHRCLTALFDMCIQQGGYARAAREIKQRVNTEHPADEIMLTHIVVEERAKKASLKYRADCLSRRLGILYRQPHPVTMNGIKARRVNEKLYLIRDVKVNGVEKYLNPTPLRNTD